MRTTIIHIGLLLWVALYSQTGLCQQGGQYNISIYNGLPSNKIYYMLEDRHGYIWIGTPKGVIQYNGYTPKVYGFESGLSNDDVWELYEDRKGRIWTSSIANELGYIYNNKYKKAVLPQSNKTLYPRDIREYPGGIMFYSTYLTKYGAMCLEKDDTLSVYDMKGYAFPFFMPIGFGAIVVSYNNKVYKVSLTGEGKINVGELCALGDGEQINTSGIVNSFENYYLGYEIDDHIVKVFDADKCRSLVIDVEAISKQKEKIKLLSFKKNREHFFYIITEKNIFKIDNTIRCAKVIPVQHLVTDPTIDGSKITGIIDDDFWGQCVGTTTAGIFLSSPSEATFNRVPGLALPDYKYLGMTEDEKGLFWNDRLATMVSIDSAFKIKKLKGKYENVVKLVRYNEDTSFLLANRGINVYSNKKETIVNRYKGYDDLNSYSSPIAMAVKNANELYLLSRLLGFSYYKNGEGTGVNKQLDFDRYNDVFYDKYSATTWVYNNKKMLELHGRNKTILDKESLGLMGISKIESIEADRFGNVFIKDYDKVLMFNYRSSTFKVLFGNYMLNGATMKIQDDRLILAGPFGVLFSTINGAMQTGDPIVLHNVKSIAYNYTYDVLVYKHRILLNTDRGFYYVDIPKATTKVGTRDRFVTNYRFLVNYNDSLYDIGKNDTISIDQKNVNLFVDVINPEGSGKAKFKYRFDDLDDRYQKLNANELHLPYLVAGRYYPLSIVAYDDVWRSPTIKMHIYIEPRWWQKTAWQRAFLFASMVLFVLLVFVVYIITKRMVTTQNTRRNLRLKLELNSIYSQINPHFIFNSLSTALFYIKKKQLSEAQAHISKFSKLLRAYIKFSRNKYITIAEERENLRNYIELQQARFENRFDYEITVDESIPETAVSIPALLLQPIVENAIDHGLLHLERKGHLKVSFIKEEGAVVCTIEDDGIGREKAKLLAQSNRTKTESYGDILIKDLVDIFNKYEKMRIKIEYTDKKEPEQGTLVRITIKNPHNGPAV